MIAFADESKLRPARARLNSPAATPTSRPTDAAFYRNPAGLVVLLTAATLRKRRLANDLSVRPGASYRPDVPDVLALREAEAYLSSHLSDRLPADLHRVVKLRLAQMFRMMDELDLANSRPLGEPGAGCAW
jgi:hypothetical protein